VESAQAVHIRQAKMSSKPVVSVIVIFLNAEQFIQEAIESVFAQTYDNWELLLVDDGSTDGSSAMACKYAEQHPERVLYLEHPDHQNFGKNASRNVGIRYARGEYIAFLDADDVWMPHKLGQQVAILDSHPEAAMVYGLSQYWYSWTGTPEDKQRDFQHELGVPPDTLIKPPALIPLFFLAQKAAIPNPSSILVRHEIIEEVNGFDEALGDYYEDQAFYAKVCLKAPVVAASECWNRYRQHPNSSSSIAQKTGLEYSSRLFFLNWLARYLSDQGVQDPKIWQALRKEVWRYRHPILLRSWRSGQHLLLLIARRTLPLPVRHWLWAKWK
jgi:glycosyltransferase involved in cell wall biosynthesis